MLSIPFAGLTLSNIVSSVTLWPFSYCPSFCLSSVNLHISFGLSRQDYRRCLACYSLYWLFSENLFILFFFWIFCFSSPSYLLLTFPKILPIFKAHTGNSFSMKPSDFKVLNVTFLFNLFVITILFLCYIMIILVAWCTDSPTLKEN